MRPKVEEDLRTSAEFLAPHKFLKIVVVIDTSLRGRERQNKTYVQTCASRNWIRKAFSRFKNIKFEFYAKDYRKWNVFQKNLNPYVWSPVPK
jgi:hypothetical protein